VSATTSGAVKAYVEQLGLSLSVHRDKPPAGIRLPYAVVHEGLALVPELDGDYGDPAAERNASELVQLDLYQAARQPATGAMAESVPLADALWQALRHTDLVVPGQQQRARVWACTVANRVRTPAGDDNVVRDTFSLAVRRRVL
jgi:hypothetical protein